MKTRKVDLAPWFWGGFYKRGILSHFLRAYSMRHIPMPRMRRPWLRTALAQCILPISMDFMIGISNLVAQERKEFVRLKEEKGDEFITIAPAGSLSPLSCDAAAFELVELCEYAQDSAKSFRKKVTIPFLIATGYELTLVVLLVFFALFPTWFLYGLAINKATYTGAILCSLLSYLFALPATLKIFRNTTMRNS